MFQEKSCGAVVYRLNNGNIEYLLLKHKNDGHWGNPKGHVENNETEKETALREVFEETGLKILLNDKFRFVEEYSPREGVMKQVIYFIGHAIECNVTCQLSEITESKWVSVEQAIGLIKHEDSKQLMRESNEFILKNI